MISLLAAAVFALFSMMPPASAGGGYEFDDAVTVNQPTYDWGYTTTDHCGSYCGTTYVKNGVTYHTLSFRGYAFRNCTDWIAYKLESLGISTARTRGRGNGKNWDDNSTGVTITTTPEVGDAAVWNSGGGGFGHVAYVEEIRAKTGGGFEARVSEYNYAGQGEYNDTRWVTADDYVDFNGVGAPLGAPPPPPTTTTTTTLPPRPAEPGTFPIAGDWDGNGTVTQGLVWRHDSAMTWFITNSLTPNGPYIQFDWGWNDGGDRSVTPVVGDWDGNGTDTPGFVYSHGSAMSWYLNNTFTNLAVTSFDWGWNGSADRSVIPVVGDWDGNGTDTPGFAYGHASATSWYLNNTFTNASVTPFDWGWNDGGTTTLFPVVGDWDGNGTDTPGFAYRHNSVLSWYINNTFTNLAVTSFDWGWNDWNGSDVVPFAGNWNGTGGDKIGFGYRNNGTITWYLANGLSASAGTVVTPAFNWGFN